MNETRKVKEGSGNLSPGDATNAILWMPQAIVGKL